ncbi:MAG: glycosyltransferase, partial [Candidatus Helarchaeota archaeon]|nr:glycosyltransferase [Candidatus Helarchaeota archaeon]
MTSHTNRIRVVHIIPSLVIGGMEQVVKTLSSGLDPEKFEVSVICIIEKGVLAEDLEKRGIGVHLIEGKRYKVLSHFYPSYLANVIKEIRPKIIHSHSGIWYASAVASRMAGVPVMVHTE